MEFLYSSCITHISAKRSHNTKAYVWVQRLANWKCLPIKSATPLARETCARQLRVKDLVFNILQDFSNRATEALRKLGLF